MFQSPFFWQCCMDTWEKKQLSPNLKVFLRDFDALRETVVTLYFPMCSSGHWFLVIISFQKKEIAVADSLKSDPPSNFYEIVRYFLTAFLEVDMTDWAPEYEREPCPRQTDGHSCGVVVLSLLDDLCSGGSTSPWCPDMAAHFRVLWLGRIIEHDKNARKLLDQGSNNPAHVLLRSSADADDYSFCILIHQRLVSSLLTQMRESAIMITTSRMTLIGMSIGSI